MKPPQKGYFSQLIAERITNGTLPSNILAMHNNFYWHRMCLEDNSQGFPCIEASLAELRGRIYRIILPRQECLVNEHGRSPWEPLRSAGVGRKIRMRLVLKSQILTTSNKNLFILGYFHFDKERHNSLTVVAIIV